MKFELKKQTHGFALSSSIIKYAYMMTSGRCVLCVMLIMHATIVLAHRYVVVIKKKTATCTDNNASAGAQCKSNVNMENNCALVNNAK